MVKPLILLLVLHWRLSSSFISLIGEPRGGQSFWDGASPALSRRAESLPSAWWQQPSQCLPGFCQNPLQPLLQGHLGSCATCWALLSSPSVSGVLCSVGLLLPTCRTLHFSLLNFTRFQPACCSSLSRSIRMSVKTFNLSATACGFSPCTCKSISNFTLGVFYPLVGGVFRWVFLFVLLVVFCCCCCFLIFWGSFCIRFWHDCIGQLNCSR